MRNTIITVIVISFLIIITVNIISFFYYEKQHQRIEENINVMVSKARPQGRFTTNLIDEFENNISKYGVDPSDIKYNKLTTTQKYRYSEYEKGEKIKWDIDINLNVILGKKNDFKFIGTAPSELIN